MAPAKVFTDRVVPVPAYDAQLALQNSMIYGPLVFEQVLDRQKLEDALVYIVKRKGWNRFASRLRSHGMFDLNFHVPTTFEDGRKVVNTSQTKYDMNIRDHETARHFVTDLSRDSIQVIPADFDEFYYPPGCPHSLKDYLNNDLPAGGYHLSSFRDASIVTFYTPHCVADGTGIAALLHTWGQVLNGNYDIPNPWPVEIDPIASIESEPQPRGLLAPWQKAAISFWGFTAANIPKDMFSKRHFKTIFVPKSQMKDLRQRAVRSLRFGMESQGVEVAEDPSLSDGDVLFSWWTKLAMSNMPSNSKQRIALLSSIALREHLPTPRDQPVLGNVLDMTSLTMEARQIKKEPLGIMASRIRGFAKSHRTPEYLSKFATWWKNTKGYTPPKTIDAGTYGIMTSNMTMGKLFDLNFSGAVSDSARTALPGEKITPLPVQVFIRGMEALDITWIVGRDREGNYWMNCGTRKEFWPLIEERIASGQHMYNDDWAGIESAVRANL